jgi:SAM-dependent methyltransferase
MAEWRLYPAGTIPEYATAAWYADRDRAAHADEPLHRPRLEAAARIAATYVNELGLGFVMDVGAGDGGLLQLLAPQIPRSVVTVGYDLQPSNVAGAAERGVDVVLGDAALHIADLGFTKRGSLVLATEMLEHLVDPHKFVAELHHAGAQVLVASSPWTETGDNHYGYHLWAWDTAGYVDMVTRSGWHVLAVEIIGMFTVLAATRSPLEAAP